MSQHTHLVAELRAGVIVIVVYLMVGAAFTVRVPVAHLDRLVTCTDVEVLVTIMVDVVASSQESQCPSLTA